MNLKSDRTCTIIGLATNLLLVIIKFFAGIVGKSQTMIADSLHSLSDGIATFAVFVSIKYSQKPPDKNHPYGHGNIEVLTAMLVALLILVTGIFLGYSAIHSLLHKHYIGNIPKSFTIYIAVLSILTKEILYHYTLYVGKKLNSIMLIANAYDHRSDAFSSVGALVAIIVAKLGIPIMDVIGSIIISAFILKMGIDIIKENVSIIMDAVPSQKMQIEIENLIQSVNGVINSSIPKIHPVGRHFYIEAEIEVDKELTVKQAHGIAEEVKNILKNYNPQIKDVTVHVEPFKYKKEEEINDSSNY